MPFELEALVIASMNFLKFSIKNNMILMNKDTEYGQSKV